MKIAIPVAAYHAYNTAVYVERAFRELGHEAAVITQAEFYGDVEADLFFCVDSAGPLDFPDEHLNKTAMWFIDSRHNNDPARRQPDDDTNAMKIHSGGGWVFQAQRQDWERNVAQGCLRSCWLPLAADPEVWSPRETIRLYDVGFGGNIWCHQRRALLDRIESEFSLRHTIGTPADLAEGYNLSRVGFNVGGWYGTPICYDVNMRVFEVVSCGLPLITNALPELHLLGLMSEHNCLTYDDTDQALQAIRYALGRSQEWRDGMGAQARSLVLDGHTYKHRMEEVLTVLFAAEMLNGTGIDQTAD